MYLTNIYIVMNNIYYFLHVYKLLNTFVVK